MSQDLSFRRKIIYIVAIVALLFPLFWIGQPATRTSAGGILAKLRAENNLAQAELGEIDPASESMKLATLGLRGVAANVLWEKANDYKKKEDWDSLSATLNQITKLQPNFITVWEHQSHNLAYNISVEFDDYRHRYHWVKKGISFLVEGTHYNRDNPRLLHYTGWITGQKIGRADEHVQFRRMFREDEDFHNELNREVPVDDAAGYDGRPDSWLVGRLWYQRAQRAVDTKGMPLRGKSPLVFHADSAMSLINYASTIEEEGILGQTAQRSWYEAGKGWAEYGQRPIPTSFGYNVRLGEYNQVNDEIVRMREALEKLAPGVRQQILDEKRAQLTEAERTALDTPEAELTEATAERHFQAKDKTIIRHEEVAKRAPESTRDRAIKLASRLIEHELLSQRISNYRGIVNYEYWEIRCAAEQTKTAVDAREFVYKARQFQTTADLDNARKMYEQAWREWKTIYDTYPRLIDDVESGELIQQVKHYDRLLRDLDAQIPADFPLIDLLRQHKERDPDIETLLKKLEAQRAAAADKPAADKPAEKPVPAETEKPTAEEKPAADPPPAP